MKLFKFVPAVIIVADMCTSCDIDKKNKEDVAVFKQRKRQGK